MSAPGVSTDGRQTKLILHLEHDDSGVVMARPTDETATRRTLPDTSSASRDKIISQLYLIYLPIFGASAREVVESSPC
jgi:hypothetical protein